MSISARSYFSLKCWKTRKQHIYHRPWTNDRSFKWTTLVNNMNSSTHPFIPAVEPQSRTRDPDDDLLLESVWHWPLPMIWLRWSSSCSLAITTCCTSVSRSGWRQDGSMWTGAISKGDISSPSIPRPIPAPSAPSLGDISSPLPPKIGAAARHVSGLSVPWSGEAEEMKCQVKGQPLYQRGHFMRSRSDHGDRRRPDPRTMDAGKTKVLISESMLRIGLKIPWKNTVVALIHQRITVCLCTGLGLHFNPAPSTCNSLKSLY